MTYIIAHDNIIARDNIRGGDNIKNMMEHLTNPTRAKIFIEIAKAEQTAKTLLELLPEISQPTMYRHIKALLDGGIITVASEKKVRGVTEKTYCMNAQMTHDIGKIVEENDGPAYYQLFVQYITAIAQQFEAYAHSPGINIIEDLAAFTTAPIYASREEIIAVSEKMAEIILPLMQNEPAPGRKLRNFCTILSPPQQ